MILLELGARDYNNLLADPLIYQTILCWMPDKSKFAKLFPYQTFLLYGIWLHHYGMENIVISIAGEQKMIFRHLVTLNIHNIINGYFPQTIDQFMSSHVERIDFYR